VRRSRQSVASSCRGKLNNTATRTAPAVTEQTHRYHQSGSLNLAICCNRILATYQRRTPTTLPLYSLDTGVRMRADAGKGSSQPASVLTAMAFVVQFPRGSPGAVTRGAAGQSTWFSQGSPSVLVSSFGYYRQPLIISTPIGIIHIYPTRNSALQNCRYKDGIRRSPCSKQVGACAPRLP
jgi:hypothetical protein